MPNDTQKQASTMNREGASPKESLVLRGPSLKRAIAIAYSTKPSVAGRHFQFNLVFL